MLFPQWLILPWAAVLLTLIRRIATRKRTTAALKIPGGEFITDRLSIVIATRIWLSITSSFRFFHASSKVIACGGTVGTEVGRCQIRSARINVTRSVSRQVITRCKTEVSRKPIPMNPEIADMLWRWRLETPYNKPGDLDFRKPTQGRNSILLPWFCVPSARETRAWESGHFLHRSAGTA